MRNFALHAAQSGLPARRLAAIPGPTTLIAPAVGFGWGFLNFGGTDNKVECVTVRRVLPRASAASSSATAYRSRTAAINMGGPQSGDAVRLLCPGPRRNGCDGNVQRQGERRRTAIQSSSSSTMAKGNVIDTGAYTLTGGDGGSVNHTAISLAQFINDSAAVTGSNANWNQASASGPNVTVSIQIPAPTVPPTTTIPTYKATNTGNVSVPNGHNAGYGRFRERQPAVVPVLHQGLHCSASRVQAQQAGADVPGHRGGPHRRWRAVVVREGHRYDRMLLRSSGRQSEQWQQPQLVPLLHLRVLVRPHEHQRHLAGEWGRGATSTTASIIANFGGGPPAVNFAVLVAPTYVGGAEAPRH